MEGVLYNSSWNRGRHCQLGGALFLLYRQFCNIWTLCCQTILKCGGNNVKGWNMMWTIIFHSLSSPLVAVCYTCYTCVCVCECVCGAEVPGHTLSSGQSLPWGLWSMAHPARHFLSPTTQDHTPSNGLAFVITSSQRNIIEVSCVGTCLKLHMLLTRRTWGCVMQCCWKWQTASPALSQRTNFAVDCFHRKWLLATDYFWKKYWGIMIPKMS